jgi:GxGYxYP putative glycoside hydrolase C-terminal domain/GxGYxYP_N second domain/GxGYxYP third domain
MKNQHNITKLCLTLKIFKRRFDFVNNKEPQFPLGCSISKGKWVFVFLVGIVLGARPVLAASGLFPKMPAAVKAYVADCSKDKSGIMTSWALEGIVNQQSAEAYVAISEWDWEQLKYSGKSFEVLTLPSGENAGLRSLFKKYQTHIKKMFLYDPEKDWTFYLALMASAQQNGIPVTEAVRNQLTTEFDWKGEVEDFRTRWNNRIEAYDWARANLMPGCNKQVVFATAMNTPLIDYAVASKGFVFWLDFDGERSEVQKIFQTTGYGMGTSLMGYANTGDMANVVANPFGIGYVTSDFYHNGSFWSSFPNKTYTQAAGRAVVAKPGKIYVSIMWSDGDNLQFDQNALYHFWRDLWEGTPHGIVPVATELSPTLQELNPPLLDWYYSRMTENDELMSGATGVQFIHIRDYNSELFPAWCKLTHDWCRDAGFHTGIMWLAPNPSAKYTEYMTTCGFDGVFGEGGEIQAGFPPKLGPIPVSSEEELAKALAAMPPHPQMPRFYNIACIVGGFTPGDRGYAAIVRQVKRAELAHPGRYVFLLPKDEFATIRNYYHLGNPAETYSDISQITALPGTDEGLTPVTAGDGEFKTIDHEGTPCWLVPKHTPPHYFYLAKDKGFRLPPHTNLEIDLEYLDVGSGAIALDYDSIDMQGAGQGAYKTHPHAVRRTNSGQWQSAQFQVNDALFAGRQNDHADFRFYNGGDDLLIRAVRVRRVEP